MKICPTCGAQWPSDANFCPKDGTNMRVVPDEEEAAQEIPAPAPVAPAPAEEEDECGIPKGFSETQWFMAAQDPEKLKSEASVDDLVDMQGDYEWNEGISEEERSKFSLRRKKK